MTEANYEFSDERQNAVDRQTPGEQYKRQTVVRGCSEVIYAGNVNSCKKTATRDHRNATLSTREVCLCHDHLCNSQPPQLQAMRPDRTAVQSSLLAAVLAAVICSVEIST